MGPLPRSEPEVNLEANPEVNPEAGGMGSTPLAVTQEDCLVLENKYFHTKYSRQNFDLSMLKITLKSSKNT